jgi:hypothetical protein
MLAQARGAPVHHSGVSGRLDRGTAWRGDVPYGCAGARTGPLSKIVASHPASRLF